MAFVFPSDFDPQPNLQSAELSLRPLQEKDRSALTQAANDPLIWAGHPAKNRYEPAIFSAYFDLLLTTGSALLIQDSEDRTIGCTVFYTDPSAPLRLSIGFTFLTREHWGGTSN